MEIKNEEQHHHHHHSHHRHSGHHHHHHVNVIKLKEWRNKKSAILIIVLCIILIASLLIVSNTRKSRKENFTVYNTENKVVVSVKDGLSIYIRYGHYDSIDFDYEADQIVTTPEYASFECLYNGEYTITANFKDGSKKTKYITINDNIEPIILSSSGKTINIHRVSNFRIDSLEYCYGLRLGDTYADYLPLDSNIDTVSAFGNGWHTFKIYATNGSYGKTYYVAVNATGFTKPNVMLINDTVGVFSYGFDVSNVYYAKGTFDSWQEFLKSNDVVSIIPNCTLSKKSFEKGTYTFCFEGKLRHYLVQIDI